MDIFFKQLIVAIIMEHRSVEVNHAAAEAVKNININSSGKTTQLFLFSIVMTFTSFLALRKCDKSGQAPNKVAKRDFSLVPRASSF